MERINILCATDNNYAPYHGVMLTSLFINNRDSQFDVYMLMDDTWDDSETSKFVQLCAKYDSEFHLIKVDNSVIKDFPQREHITLPTYYRLLACELLPKTIHKILLLDGDIIIRGDIRPLWNINLEGYAFAGVEDMDSITGDCFSRLGYDCEFGYYNAGVSLYNFDYWRDNHVSEQLVELIRTQPDRMKWMDQDAVNFLLHDKRYKLPLRYNFQVYYLDHTWWDLYSDDFHKEIESECQSAIIIHYNGRLKPWSFRYNGFPFARLWKHYQRLSLWEIKDNSSWFKRFKRCVKRVFFPWLAYENRNALIVRRYWSYE